MNKHHIRILVVDDEEIVRESLSEWLAKDGYALAVAPDGPSAIAMLERQNWSILLVDMKMPGMDGLHVLEEVKKRQPNATVVIMTAYATVDTAVSAIKLGAYDYLVKPFDPEELTLLVEKIVAQQALVRENAVLRRALKREFRFRDLVSRNARMQSLLALARTAAASTSTILILGESGTGKEVLARAIHNESPRRAGAFVAVSCAALTDTLLESELFGHERGAFTGAVARQRGKFEAADGGTLFLDEIGDVSPKLQLDLLRVLEERRVTRVGSVDAVPVDVRIIAATNRDLKEAVARGAFREDLFYRLNVISVSLPPLRERKEDIPLLAETLLETLAAAAHAGVEGFSHDALKRLLAYDWPGNIREMRNVIERALVVCDGPVLQAADVDVPAAALETTDRLCSLDDVERRHIAYVLEHVGGNVTHAARVLDIDRVTLYNKIRKYHLRDGEEPQPALNSSSPR